MSALTRNLLRLAYGLPPDAEELGRIFDATPLYGLDEPFIGSEGDRGRVPGTHFNA